MGNSNNSSNNSIAFYHACKYKNDELALKLMDEDMKCLDYTNNDEVTNVLHWIIVNNMEDIAFKVIDKFVNNNLIDEYIELSINNDVINIALKLIDKDEDNLLNNKNYLNKLFKLSIKNNLNLIIDKLTEIIKNQNQKKINCLYYACYYNNTEIALKFINSNIGDIYYIDENEKYNTPLLMAIKNKMYNVINLIIDKYPDTLNYIDELTGYTPIICTIENNMKDIAYKILDYNIDNTYISYKNNYALSLAIDNKMEDISLKIINLDKNEIIDNQYYYSKAIESAIKHNSKNIINKLCQLNFNTT